MFEGAPLMIDQLTPESYTDAKVKFRNQIFPSVV